MAESQRTLDVLGYPDMGQTYEEGYAWGERLVEQGYDGLWSQALTSNPDSGALREAVLDPDFRQKLQDTNAVKEAYRSFNDPVANESDEFYSSLFGSERRTEMSGYAVALNNSGDFSQYLSPTAEQASRLATSPALSPADAALSLARCAPEVIGALHAVQDSNGDARIIGSYHKSTAARLANFLADAQDELLNSLTYLNTPADAYMKAIETMSKGFRVANILGFRAVREQVYTDAQASHGNHVAVTGAQILQYQAHSRIFKDTVGEHGFSVTGDEPPINEGIAAMIKEIEADMLLPDPPQNNDHNATVFGSIAYMLQPDRYRIDNDWWHDWRVKALGSLTETEAQQALADLLRIQQAGYRQKHAVPIGAERGRITEEYRNRMTRLCRFWLPSFFEE